MSISYYDNPYISSTYIYIYIYGGMANVQDGNIVVSDFEFLFDYYDSFSD